MFSDIRDVIVQWDNTAWFYLNTQWRTPCLDAIVPYFRNPLFWIPLYFFLAVFIPVKFGRRGLLWCLAFMITFSLSDQVSATLLKPFFHRLRPCQNPYLGGVIHQLVPCGGLYGFPSSHASNHFAIGIFSAVTLGAMAKWVWPVAVFWALLVCYAQVYVGVHYPLDVTCGGLLGATIGIGTGRVFNRYFNLAQPSVSPGIR